MKKYIMYVNLADDPSLPEDINSLPIIQIVRERIGHRSVGIEQVTEAILAVATFLEQHSEYIPFRVEIIDSNESNLPPVTERRRRRRRRTTRTTEGGVR